MIVKGIKIFIFFVFVIFSITKVCKAQYYDSGQDPFSINWKQIQTPYFQIVFPSEIEKEAKKYASYLSEIHKTGGKTLKQISPKIPVLIHNQTIISNGEVAWTPKRMNLYTVAPQDNYFQPWAQHLSLHEFRHTAHISKINQGFTHGLTYIFGEQAIAGILGLHVPFWFMEGDAVAYETGATESGRGRVPDFQMKLKAQLVDNGIYSYPKAMFGSYKDFVPNHYELGYYLVANARKNYGYDIWEQVLTRVGRNPIHPNPFSAGIKEVTSLPERKLYSASISELKKETEKEINEKQVFNAFKEKLSNNDYENYYCPTQYSSGLIALKTSYKKIARFIRIDSLGNEHKIILPGHVFNNTYSLSGDKMVWNAFHGTRWSNRNFSRIVVFDIVQNKKRYIENRGRIFSSRISPNGNKIVSTEVSNKVEWSITIRESSSGILLQSFAFDTLQPIQPDWSPNSDEIVFIAIGDNGKSLGIINLQNNNIRWILKNEKLEFSHPKYSANFLVVKGVYNNVSNFYKYSFENEDWSIITNVQYGVGEGNVEGSNLFFSNYTAKGFKIDKVDLKDAFAKEKTKPQKYYSILADNLSEDEVRINFDSLETNFTVKNYSRLKHFINIHSWAPMAINISNEEVGLGVSVMSQNVLSTSFLSAGYQYHWAEQQNELYFDYTYKGFYPILSLLYQYFSPLSFYKADANDILRRVEYDVHSLSLKSAFPFVFDYGPWFLGLQPEFAYSYDAAIFKENDYFIYENSMMHCFNYGFNGYHLLRKSHRDLYPKWGQTINLQYKHAPFDTAGYILSAKGKLYFPGILANHSFRISGGYQSKESGVFGFSDYLVHPRGYTMVENEEMANTSFNYSFPVLYPDLNAWEYIYLKRLKANLFYDAARYYYNDNASYQESYGVELTADFHAFRFVAPIQLGIRYARKRTVNQNYFGVLFSIDFNALY